MAADEPYLLPQAPPPRPARRDAAIEAALRRFDGVEAPSVDTARQRPRPRGGFGSRPWFGALATASLVVVIGVPAALIAIRNSDLASPPPPLTPAPMQRETAAADSAAMPSPDAAAPPDMSKPSAASAPANLPAPNRRQSPPDESESVFSAAPPVAAAEPLASAAAGPPGPAFAPPAAPPPPPPPSAERDEAYSEDGQIVVSGSRIENRSQLTERIRDGRGRSLSSAQKSNAPTTAPKWVVQNGAYRRFLGQLQAAVRANDRAAVARLMRLPLRVNYAGGSKTYRDARALIGDYERIVTPRVRQAILAQRFENLFGRDQGVMIGDGAVWFDHSCRTSACSPPGPVRITAINP